MERKGYKKTWVAEAGYRKNKPNNTKTSSVKEFVKQAINKKVPHNMKITIFMSQHILFKSN